MVKQIALRVEVATYRGTREGVPRLLELLKKHGAQASFFFSLGPDQWGRGVFGRHPRVGLLEHYGIKSLLYGTVLPAPVIAETCGELLRTVRDEGFEVGVLENVAWQNQVSRQTFEWTRRAMQASMDRFIAVFGESPQAHAASGWQVNRDALRLSQRLGFVYASDTRGTCPFIPTWDAEIVACPQLPTTLPTLDELLVRKGVTPENVAEHLLAFTGASQATSQVFTLRAELEGGKWLPIFEQLMRGWDAQGYQLSALRQVLEQEKANLSRHAVKMAEVSGVHGLVAMQD